MDKSESGPRTGGSGGREERRSLLADLARAHRGERSLDERLAAFVAEVHQTQADTHWALGVEGAERAEQEHAARERERREHEAELRHRLNDAEARAAHAEARASEASRALDGALDDVKAANSRVRARDTELKRSQRLTERVRAELRRAQTAATSDRRRVHWASGVAASLVAGAALALLLPDWLGTDAPTTQSEQPVARAPQPTPPPVETPVEQPPEKKAPETIALALPIPIPMLPGEAAPATSQTPPATAEPEQFTQPRRETEQKRPGKVQRRSRRARDPKPEPELARAAARAKPKAKPKDDQQRKGGLLDPFATM